ncbi:hypothetical protein TcCL_NonESM00981 [Trypanosoma cruzi]|nr:hypothetical protein TcCL_Unassigned04067 [Trypanosoma cruzi]RNC49147.1 hypothetical protein TcCL_NonESM00981 [Trypanosoma cruzi]
MSRKSHLSSGSVRGCCVGALLLFALLSHQRRCSTVCLRCFCGFFVWSLPAAGCGGQANAVGGQQKEGTAKVMNERLFFVARGVFVGLLFPFCCCVRAEQNKTSICAVCRSFCCACCPPRRAAWLGVVVGKRMGGHNRVAANCGAKPLPWSYRRRRCCCRDKDVGGMRSNTGRK